MCATPSNTCVTTFARRPPRLHTVEALLGIPCPEQAAQVLQATLLHAARVTPELRTVPATATVHKLDSSEPALRSSTVPKDTRLVASAA